jgi:hypothetical protein
MHPSRQSWKIDCKLPWGPSPSPKKDIHNTDEVNINKNTAKLQSPVIPAADLLKYHGKKNENPFNAA